MDRPVGAFKRSGYGGPDLGQSPRGGAVSGLKHLIHVYTTDKFHDDRVATLDLKKVQDF
jgi:hypothetical protein